MTLIHAFHTCPEGDKDNEKATLAFEEMIIEKMLIITFCIASRNIYSYCIDYWRPSQSN